MDASELYKALFDLPDSLDRITDALHERPGLPYQLWHPWREHGHLPIDPDTWIWLFRTAGYTENYESAPVPENPILLYRGASDDRRLGMAWTSNYSEAKKFATQDGRDRPYKGNIYTHWATPAEMLANYTAQDGKYWDEIVLDPCYLHDGNVFLTNVSEMATRRVLAAL